MPRWCPRSSWSCNCPICRPAVARREAVRGLEQVRAAAHVGPLRPHQFGQPGGGVEHRGPGDHAGGVDQPVQRVAARPLGLAFARQARRATPSNRAVQRRVMAVGELGADADAADVLREAHAEQVDVVGVDQVVRGTPVPRASEGLRQLVGEVAVVEAERAVEPVGAPARGQAELAALIGLDGLPRREAERQAERPGGPGR